MSAPRHVVALAATSLLGTAQAVDLQALWDFGNPGLSEQRFRAAMESAAPDDRLILQTQIARTHGLRRDFVKARELLAAMEPDLKSASPEARVRHALELGRTYASASHRKADQTAESAQAAREHFTRAHELAAAARLDDLAIDALHMMVFVDTAPEQQLAWNRKAIAAMERSDQPAAKRWEGSLRNNVGYALQEQGDHPAAIEQFQLSRAAYERAGRARNVRIADWMIARSYRAMGRLDDALALQLALERAWEAAGETDPYVFEELEAIYRARGDEPKARHYGDRLKAARAKP